MTLSHERHKSTDLLTRRTESGLSAVASPTERVPNLSGEEHFDMPAPDQIQCPDEPSQEKLIVRIDKVIPSDLRLLDDSIAEIVTLIKRVAGWDDVENIDLSLR